MEEIWWGKVPNAVAFISDIVYSLLSEKSVILTCSGEFPWHTYMISTITEAVKQKNGSKQFEYADDIQDPGAYLLQEFCKPEKRAEYRPTKSYARFFAESDDIVLHERFHWVKVYSKEQLNAWMNLISEYVKARAKNRESAAFILEWISNKPVQAKKGIKIYSLDEYISGYDKIVFCTLASSSVKEKTYLKNYLTELSASVVENDIELCAECMADYRRFLLDPYLSISRITQEKLRSDGNNYSFTKTKDDVNHAIWLAQIRTIFPLLEEYRERFVRKYKSVIEKQLPITSSNGERYDDPRDVELGTLKYMADNRLISFQQKDYECLNRYRNARNKLSHLTPLTLEEIEHLKA